MTDQPRFRIGVDVGGTHTDLVLLDPVAGSIAIEKVPSTPSNPALAVLDGGVISAEPAQSGDVEIDFTQPQWASVGVSVLVTPDWRVNMDVKWVDYSVLKELVFEFDQDLDYLVLASVVNNLADIYS